MDSKDPLDLQNLQRSADVFVQSDWVNKVMLMLRPKLMDE